MAYIDKLISKFNKAKQAINSLKGIQSKIQSINYTTAMDALGEAQNEAQTLLDARRASLQSNLGVKGIGKNYSERRPKESAPQLIYPFHDELTNYMLFSIRPRRDRGGGRSDVHQHRSIALYVPDALISQSVVTYQADGVSPMARALNEVVETFKKGGAGDGFSQMGEQLNKQATKFLQQTANTMTGGLSNLKEGRAVNPQQEQLLNGIPFRSWDFTFDFWPKSKDEAEKVNQIIYTFRSSMLPDAYSEGLGAVFGADADKQKQQTEEATYRDDTTFIGRDVEVRDIQVETNPSYFNYPNVFDISFEGPLGSKIDGFLPAVCTNAQVDYTGGQKFSTFADGQPVHIQLTLNFLEIKTMTLGNYQAIRAGGTGVQDDTSLIDRQSRSAGQYNKEVQEGRKGTPIQGSAGTGPGGYGGTPRG